MATLDAELDEQVRAAIDKAVNAISQMREPFASTSQDKTMHDVNFAAVDACNELTDILDEVIEVIEKN